MGRLLGGTRRHTANVRLRGQARARQSVKIGKLAMAQSAFVSCAQNHAGRLARLECFLPPGAQRHQRSPGFRPRKPNSGIGVERSLPRDLENSRNAVVMTTQTVWLP